MNAQSLKSIVTFCSLLFFLFGGHSQTVGDTLRTVAFSGDPAPGNSTGVNFSTVGDPSLNNAGQTAFWAGLTGTGVDDTNNLGIWSEGGGSGLALVARTGEATPGTAAAFKFSGFNIPVLNDAGQTAFISRLSGIGENNRTSSSIWSEGGGNGLELVAITGEAAPGTSAGVNFSSFKPRHSRFVSYFNTPAFNNAGQTAFWAGISGDGVDYANARGIWSEGGGSGLALVARTGEAAPGTSEGVNFSNFNLFNSRFNFPVLNDAGQMAFRANLTGTNNLGIWSEGGGNGLALVAREGGAVPGTSAGVFNWLDPPLLNSSGQTAFKASLIGAEYRSGIWLEGGGSGLALVARTEEAAPGTQEGVNFSGFFDTALNDAGQTAFMGFLRGTGVDGTNSNGIWSEGSDNGLTLVARTGDPAPGTPEGVKFSFLPTAPNLNNAGQTAFNGILTGTGVDSTNNLGIWAEDPHGVLKLIAREGDLLDVDDGPGTDFRTIYSLLFHTNTGNVGGRSSGFNDLGQLAFRATFTDGTSGVFVSNLVAVPEPGALLLAVVGVLGMGTTRRNRQI